MENTIPLLQSLVWPVFILILIFWGRRSILRILEAIRERIESGDTLEAGSSGLKLTSSGKVVKDSGPQRAVCSTSAEEISLQPSADKERKDEEAEVKEEETDNPGFYVVHKVRRDKSLDHGDYEYYRIRIFLETEPGVDLAGVKKVVYHFIEGFSNPDRTVTDTDTQFELRTSAWGQFYLTADVYLEDRQEPLRLGRYLNF